MYRALIIVGVAALIVAGNAYYAYYNLPRDTSESSMNNSPVQITPIEHATTVFSWSGATLYLDPTGGAEVFAGQSSPTIVLITDIHGDHFSADTVEAVLGNAALIVPEAVRDELPESLVAKASVLSNGDNIEVQGFSIEAVPMYNLPDAENSNFHIKGRGNGYLIERDGFRLYIAGDTAGTPEMRAMHDIDIALVPMNLPYTMGVDEAADAVLAFKPKVVIPYHYRGTGGLGDVSRFKQLVDAGGADITVLLLEWYPNQ
ncbi:MAG TPA: MBL fold metallo-hydrolase [Candidatus Paceibacterota bacterium]